MAMHSSQCHMHVHYEAVTITNTIVAMHFMFENTGPYISHSLLNEAVIIICGMVTVHCVLRG